MNFEFTNETTIANLLVNKRKLKWRPFWKQVYTLHKALIIERCSYKYSVVKLTHATQEGIL